MESRSRLSNGLQSHRVPELADLGLDAVLSSDGTVHIAAGGTAMVAHVRDHAGRDLAVRVAQEYGAGAFWQRHYQSMEAGLPRSARTYFPMDISPIPGGITLVGRKMPTVVMEWIGGPTLFAAIDRAASRGNHHVLDALAGALHDLSIGLRDSRVTHGDLTPQNLMLRANGDIVCVDLDTLEWPGARKRVHEDDDHAYRHPRRSGTPAHQDAFAILVMFASIVILRETPGLRDDLGQAPTVPNGALLFNPWDLRQPQQSDAFAAVRERTTSRGRAMLTILAQACETEAFRAQQMLDEAFDLVPLDDAVEHAVPAWSPAEEAFAANSDGDDLDLKAAVARLRELYGQQPADPGRPTFNFAETWPEPVAEKTAPPLLPVAEPRWEDEPSAPVDVVKRPLERLTRRPARSLARVLEDEARSAREIDREIVLAARSEDDDRVLALSSDAEARHLVLEEETRRLIRQSRERADFRARLNRALDQHDRRDLADLAVSGALALLGDTTRDVMVKVLQALEWPSLLRALETDDDTLITLWYDEELFDDDRSLPPAMRMRVELARQRLAWLDQVRARLRDADADALESLVTTEPSGGRLRLSPSERRRVGELIDRKRALGELERSLRSGNTPRIVSALRSVEKTGATIEDPHLWADVRAIVAKADIVRAAITAARQRPPDDRALASIVPRLKELGLAHDPALRGEYGIDRLEYTIIRGAAVRRIRRGIQRNDDRAIRLAAFPDATGALALLSPTERDRVELARSRKRVKLIDV